jgi:raffinose/stachyose/melibiose transport system permease protein
MSSLTEHPAPAADSSTGTQAPGASLRRARTGRRRRRPSVASLLIRAVLILVLTALAVAVIYPLVWMLLSGLKSNSEIFGNAWGLPGAFRWHHFVEAWNQGVVRYLGNSVFVTAASIVLVTLFSSWAAYALTRLHIPFSQPLLLLILGGLMLSPTVALIPLFRLLQTLHIYDTYWALIILYTAFRIPFTTFLIRAYMLGLPREVEDAAVIDGANRWQTFWQVVFPLCRPIIVSAGLLQALFAWNEFAFALVFINNDALKTLPVGLVAMQSRLLTDWPVLFAGLAIAALPMMLLFLLGQRQFVRGLAEGIGK